MSGSQASEATNSPRDASADRTPLDERKEFIRGMLFWPGLASFVAVLTFLGGAALHEKVDWARGAVWSLVGGTLTIAVLALAHISQLVARRLLEELRADGPLRFEKHWGGLGGASTGWSLSRSFATLIALALSLGALLAVLNQVQSFGVHLLGSAAAPPAPGSSAAAPLAAEPRASAAPSSGIPQGTARAESPTPKTPDGDAVPAAGDAEPDDSTSPDLGGGGSAG